MNEAELKQWLEKHRGQQSQGQGGGKSEYNWYSGIPKEIGARCVLRILPKFDNQPVPGRIIYKHWKVGDKSSATCFKTWNKECPICEVLNAYEGRLDTSQWQANASAAMNVLIVEEMDRDGNTINSGKYDPTTPYILFGTANNLYWVVDKMLDKNVGDVSSAKEGSVVTFTRKDKDIDKVPARMITPIHKDENVVKEILDKRVDFSKLWREPDDNFLKDIRKCADSLRNQIETRLLTLNDALPPKADPPPAAPPKADPPPAASPAAAPPAPPAPAAAPPAPAAAPPAPAPTTTTTKALPEGLPEEKKGCFGVKFNKDNPDCIMCAYEDTCK